MRPVLRGDQHQVLGSTVRHLRRPHTRGHAVSACGTARPAQRTPAAQVTGTWPAAKGEEPPRHCGLPYYVSRIVMLVPQQLASSSSRRMEAAEVMGAGLEMVMLHRITTWAEKAGCPDKDAAIHIDVGENS
jgi:hypothetical protein